MSFPTHPGVPLSGRIRAHRLIALAAVLALAATTAVLIAVAIGTNSTSSSAGYARVAAVRSDGGPEESGVAAAVSPRPSVAASTDESRIAAAISPRPTVAATDESRIAAAIGLRPRVRDARAVAR